MNLSSMAQQGQITTSKHVQRILTDKSLDCIFVVDVYGVIQGVNATLVREFRYQSKDDLADENISLLINRSTNQQPVEHQSY